MSCPPRCAGSPNDTSGISRSPVKSFREPSNATPQMIRSSSPSPARVLQNRPAGRYDSLQRAVRGAKAPLSSTMYSDLGGQNPSMNVSQDVSAISSPPMSPPRLPQATYIGSPPRRDVSPAFQQISERPSRTIRSSTITKGPGRETVVQEVKEIFDRSTRRQPQSPGNTTYNVAPLTNSRQVSFNPPANSTFYGHSMLDSSEIFDSSESACYTSSCNRSKSPYPTSIGYTSDATYTKPTKLPRSTFVVPRQYGNTSHVTPKSLYDTRPCSNSYDSSGLPYEMQTFSEEITETFDSSDEMDDSLLGKVLRGEIGRNIQPMTPSDPKDATFNRTNATYSVTPMQSASSVECPCSDPDASLSFHPPASSTAKKQIKSSIEDELTRREHEERVQLEEDLYRWQQARRRLVLDSSLSDYPS